MYYAYHRTSTTDQHLDRGIAELEAMNKIIVEATGDDKAKKTFAGYIDEIWKYAMENSDTQLKTAQKPSRSRKDREQGE